MKRRILFPCSSDYHHEETLEDSILCKWISQWRSIDTCRTVTLTYGSDVNVKGIDGYRFTFGDVSHLCWTIDWEFLSFEQWKLGILQRSTIIDYSGRIQRTWARQLWILQGSPSWFPLLSWGISMPSLWISRSIGMHEHSYSRLWRYRSFELQLLVSISLIHGEHVEWIEDCPCFEL